MYSLHKKPRADGKAPIYVLNHQTKRHRCSSVRIRPKACIGYFYGARSEQKQRFHPFFSDVRPQAMTYSSQRPCIAMATKVLIVKEPLGRGAEKPIAVVGSMMLLIYLVLSTTLL